MTHGLQNQITLQKEIWMNFLKLVNSQEFMVGGCTHIAVVFSAHTNHKSKEECAEARQNTSNIRHDKNQEKEPTCKCSYSSIMFIFI